MLNYYFSSKDFLSNLLKSCREVSYLREDGKAISRGDYLFGLLFGRDSKSHFKKICHKLVSDPEVLNEFKKLNYEEKLEIYSWLMRIKKRINNKEIRRECDENLHKIEEVVFEDKENIGGSQRINDVFLQCLESSSKHNAEELGRGLRKFYTLIEHYEGEYSIISEVSNKWSDLWTTKAKELKEEDENNSSSFLSYLGYLTDSFIQLLGLDQWINLTNYRSQKILHRTHDRVLSKLMRVQNEILSKKNPGTLNAHSYASLFRHYFLTNLWNGKGNSKEVKEQFSIFLQILKNNKNNQEFIYECLIEIENILKDLHRKGEHSYVFLPGSIRSGKVIIQSFFDLVEENYAIIDRLDNQRDFKGESRLGLRLKLLLANYPCPRPRTAYPRIMLSEKEQLNILIAHFQIEEDQRVGRLCKDIEERGVNDHIRKKLAKLINTHSRLSFENLQLVRNVIGNVIEKNNGGKPLIDWRDKDNIIEHLKAIPHQNVPINEIDNIHRLEKTKYFFCRQISFPEYQVLIPRWFDAPNEHDFKIIVINGEKSPAQKSQKKSSHRKKSEYILHLSQRIFNLKVDLHTIATTDSYSAKFIRESTNPTDKKTAIKTKNFLWESGLINSTVLSARQVTYMERQVQNIFADPYLSDQWSGYEPLYSEYQSYLETLLHQIPINSQWFRDNHNGHDQLEISKILQSVALPCYQLLLPLSLSFQDKYCRVRMSLQNEEEYATYTNKVKAHAIPTRDISGSMHCVRNALWTQVMRALYVKLGRSNLPSSIPLAIAGAFQNIASEADQLDYWNEESSEKLEIVLRRGGLSQLEAQPFVNAVRDINENSQLKTDLEMILHDANELEKIRFREKKIFDKTVLQVWSFITSEQQGMELKAILNDISNFIQVTENIKLRNALEYESSDLYGDVIRLLFDLGTSRNDGMYLALIDLLKFDVMDILEDSKENKMTKKLYAFIN